MLKGKGPETFLGSPKLESMIWEGRPDYHPRRIGLTVIGIPALSIALPYIAERYSQERGVVGLLAFLAILLAINLYIVYMYGGTRYYVTTNRIGRSQRFTGRVTEIPLEAVEIVTVKHRWGGGFLHFRAPDGRSVRFGLLRDDPEKVRRIVLEARSAVSDRSRISEGRAPG